MSNETVNQDVKQESVSDNAKNPTDNQVEKQNMIPQARFNEINSQNKELAQKIANYEAKEEANRKKQLEEEGNYKQLIDEQSSELKGLREFKTTIDAQMKDKKERLIKQLPEDQRAIYGGLSVDALEQHVNLQTNVQKVNTDTTQPSRVGNQEMGGYKSFAEWAENDPESYNKANQSPMGKGIKIGYGG